MPGPISDSYDPEFGTVANADTVRSWIKAVKDRLAADYFGSKVLVLDGPMILAVARGAAGNHKPYELSPKEATLILYALQYVEETL